MAGMMRIGMMNTDDSIDSIECAYDGMVETRLMLARAYMEESRLRRLFDRGNLSWVECVSTRDVFGMDTVRTTIRPAGSPMMHCRDFTEFLTVAQPFNMILIPGEGWMCSHGRETTVQPMFSEDRIG